MGNKPRVLIIAEAANPNWVSVPLIGWSLSNALRRVADVHIVTHIRNKAAIASKGWVEGSDFDVINSERIARPLHKFSNFLRGHSGKAWTIGTAISTLSYYYFEHLIWKRFSHDIRAGRYDLVHRITPLSPTTPSLLAGKCARARVPFVLGPINGGVPWPKEFIGALSKEKEWLSYLRAGYKLLPGYRSTLYNSSAVIAGSKYTLSQIPTKYRNKCVYLPENGVDTKLFFYKAKPYNGEFLRACFVGRLVPYKGPDMLIEASAQLVKEGRLKLDIFGNGPMLKTLKSIIAEKRLSNGVKLHGWIQHDELQKVMCESQLMILPSIREFGGGVVLEAMALGIVPIVVDYAGPSELVQPDIGFKVPLGRREDVITGLCKILHAVASKPEIIRQRSKNARDYVLANYSWERKAQRLLEIYNMVIHGKQNGRLFSISNLKE